MSMLGCDAGRWGGWCGVAGGGWSLRCVWCYSGTLCCYSNALLIVVALVGEVVWFVLHLRVVIILQIYFTTVQLVGAASQPPLLGAFQPKETIYSLDTNVVHRCECTP